MLFTPISFDGQMKIHSLGADITMRPIDTEDIYLGYEISLSNGFIIWAEKNDCYLGCRRDDLFYVQIYFNRIEWVGKLLDEGFESELMKEYYSEEELIDLCDQFSRRDKPKEMELVQVETDLE